MRTIQEYFDASGQKDRQKIFLEGDKIGEVDGNTLIIEDFKELESVYISGLPNLTKLTIKDCVKLDSLILHSEKEIEVILVGDIKLKNIKSNNINKNPTIIYQEKPKEGFCIGCLLNSAALIGIVVLTVIIVKLSNKINELREFIKELQNRLKLK